MGVARRFATIPGPKPLPILGNSWRFAIGQKPWRTRSLDVTLWNLRALAGMGGAAKVARLFGHPDLIFPFCADETAKIYRREDAMPHRAVAPCLRHYKQELRKDFFGDEPGLIGVHGSAWSTFRSKVSKALAAPQAAQVAVPSLDCVSNDFVHRMESILDHNRELPCDFLTELYKWALECKCVASLRRQLDRYDANGITNEEDLILYSVSAVGAWALGTRLGCLKDNDTDAMEIIKNIHGFFHSVPELELSAPIWRLYRTRAYRTYIEALDSFRNLCLKRLTDKGVCAQIAANSGEKVATILALDLLLVGVDTTAAAAASTMYLLATNPRTQRRLQTELDINMPTDRSMNHKDLNNLPYLKACIKEALRMKPVILGNGRCIQSDAVIAGYEVPRGSHIVFPHYIMSNEERYFPSPNDYIPERWLRDDTNKTGTVIRNISNEEHIEADRSICEHARVASVMKKQRDMGIHPFASLPFGFGRRMCIGKRFAEAELQLLIARVFQKYNVSWYHGELTYSVTPTYIPNEPLQFRLDSRTKKLS